MSKEFFTCDGALYALEDGKTKAITEKDTDFIGRLLDRIGDFTACAIEYS